MSPVPPSPVTRGRLSYTLVLPLLLLLLLQRRRRSRRVEPKVKVESAVVDMATGKTPTNAVGEAESRVVQLLAAFFSLLLVEGLLLAGSVSTPARAGLYRAGNRMGDRIQSV